MSRAETLSERRVQFGILTNGRVWRLYWQGAKSRSEEFFELDLPSLLSLRTIAPGLLAPPEGERGHWLRAFLLLFGRASFVDTDAQGRSFHPLALDEGKTWESEVARDLSRLVFGEVFPTLVRPGFAGMMWATAPPRMRVPAPPAAGVPGTSTVA